LIDVFNELYIAYKFFYYCNMDHKLQIFSKKTFVYIYIYFLFYMDLNKILSIRSPLRMTGRRNCENRPVPSSRI